MKRFAYFCWLFAVGLWDIARLSAQVALGMLAMIGALAVSDALTAKPMPEVRPLCKWVEFSSSQPMHRAIWLLDDVCPEVAAWVRDRRDSGHLVYVSGKDYFACWNHVTKTLYIDGSALYQSDGNLAATLAHEYFHSRQSWFARLRAALAYRCGCGPEVTEPSSLVEAPAYEWGDKVRRAIEGAR